MLGNWLFNVNHRMQRTSWTRPRIVRTAVHGRTRTVFCRTTSGRSTCAPHCKGRRTWPHLVCGRYSSGRMVPQCHREHVAGSLQPLVADRSAEPRRERSQSNISARAAFQSAQFDALVLKRPELMSLAVVETSQPGDCNFAGPDVFNRETG